MQFEKRSCTDVQRASQDFSATRSRFVDAPRLRHGAAPGIVEAVGPAGWA